MRVVMVNDCAFVGETLIKYFPSDVEVKHLKRSRGFFDKTFGVAWKILRREGDLYHVHYLLQDCYLALKFGKHPLIGHAHGSDLRDTLHSKKWGWIVKYNLKNCDKILVAQPTILDTAKEFNDTVEYFPIPYDPKLFYPKPLPSEREVKHVLLVSPYDFRVKGTDKFLYALARVKIPLKVRAINYGKDADRAYILAKRLGLKIEFVNRVPHGKISELYWDADLVLGSFGVGQLDTVAIEATACGRPVVHLIIKKFYPNCPLEEFNSIEECVDLIEKLLIDKKAIEKQVKAQLTYAKSTHAAPFLAKKLIEIYKNLMSL